MRNRAARAAWRWTCALLIPGAGCAPESAGSDGDVLRAASSSATLPNDPAALAAALAVPLDSLLAAGRERYDRQEWDSARAILGAEVRRARGVTDPAAEARALMWAGLAAYRRGDYATARAEQRTALGIKQRIGLDGELARSFNGLGLLSWQEGRHHEALVLFDSAFASAERNRDAPGVARAVANRSLVQVELGQFDDARRGFETAAATGRSMADGILEGNALANLGMLEIRLGDPRAALDLLAEARALYAVTGHGTGEANALGQLAAAWNGLGDPQRAIAYADSGIALARAEGLTQEVAATLEVAADAHLAAGEIRLALQRLREADSLDTVLGLAVERGLNLRRQAAIQLMRGDGTTAVALAREATAAHLAVDARAEVVYDRLQLAMALAATGALSAARSEARLATGDAARFGNAFAARDAALVSARLALAAGDARSAARTLESLPVADGRSDWAVRDALAAAQFALGRTEAARVSAEAAVAGVERSRARTGAWSLGGSESAERLAPYVRLVGIHLSREDTAAAFRVASRVPGRRLGELLAGVPRPADALGALSAGESLLRRASAIERELAALAVGAETAEQRDGLVASLASVRNAYELHLARSATSDASRLLGAGDVTADRVRQRLAPDEAVLTMLSGAARLELFIARHDRLQHVSIPIGERELAARVRLARGMLTVPSSDPGGVPPVLGEMHRLLLEPVIASGALEGATRLIVVPHGALGALPLAALFDRRTGRFVVQDLMVTYVPTVAAVAEAASGAPRGDERVAVFAPLTDSLPATEREARAIVRIHPDGQLFRGAAGDEPNVRRVLADGRPVHIASHAVSASDSPLFSRIHLRSGRGAASARGVGSERDGRLEVHEILRLRSASPLVFLSGCETGLGAAGLEAFGAGSGDASLAQAFLVAGVGTVVATLWRVSDREAALVAEGFYRHRRAGHAAADALALSQRDALERGASLTWAAYALFENRERKSDRPVRVTGTEP